MKKLLLALTLLTVSAFAQTFTEFYVNPSTGSNANAGHPASGGIYPKSYVGGSWVQSTAVFTVASGNPSSDGVQVGDFASVNPGTDAVFICRITAVSTTTFTCSTTAMSGTNPANGTYTAIIGGDWKGPNGTDIFPFAFITNAAKDASGDMVRVNFKNNATYTMTAQITQTQNGAIAFQGYNAAPGDGGRALLNWTTTSNGGLNIGGQFGLHVKDFEISANSTSAADGAALSTNGGYVDFQNIVVHGWGSYCINNVAGATTWINIEVYNCNRGAGGASAIFNQYAAVWVRPYIHDNLNNNQNYPGIRCGESCWFIKPIIANNHGDGILSLADLVMYGGDIYNNTGSGINIGWVSGPHWNHIENVVIAKNGGYGITYSGSVLGVLEIFNAAFGAGTYANTSGQTNLPVSYVMAGTITLPSNSSPWTDPTNGNFSTSLSQAKGVGFDLWLQTDGTHSGTVSYPDVGAAQSQGTAGTRVY